MKKIYVMLLLTIPYFLVSITLEESIKKSLQNNEELLSSNETAIVAEKNYRDIKGQLLPQISGSIGLFKETQNLPDKYDINMPSISSMLENPTDNESTIGKVVDGFIDTQMPEMKQTNYNYGTNIKMDQVIYLGGKLISGIKAAKLYQLLTETQKSVTKDNIIFQTKQKFYQTLLAEKAVEINREAVQTANKHFENVSKMNEHGLVSEYDMLRAELEVSKLKPQLEESLNNYKLAKEAFCKHIGVENAELEGAIKYDTESEFPEISEAVETGLVERNELKILEIQEKMYGLQYKAEKGNFLPNVAFNAEFNHFAQNDEFGFSKEDFGTSYKYGIGMSIPLFTGFSNKSKAEKAYHELKKSQFDKSKIEKMIELEIKSNHYNLTKSISVLKIKEKNVNLAKRGLKIARARFNNNIGIQLEVLDAQLQLNITKLELANAQFSTIINYELLLKSMGK